MSQKDEKDQNAGQRESVSKETSIDPKSGSGRESVSKGSSIGPKGGS